MDNFSDYSGFSAPSTEKQFAAESPTRHQKKFQSKLQIWTNKFSARLFFSILLMLFIGAVSGLINWQIFGSATLCSILFALSVGFLSTIIGTIFAVTACISHRRILVLGIALVPLFFPSIATGILLLHSPLPIPAYSWELLGWIYFIHSVPVACILQIIFLIPNFNAFFAAAAVLGIAPSRALQKILIPRLKNTFGITAMLVAIWIIFDSSANLVYAGTQSPLAEIFYHALSAGPINVFDALKISILFAFAGTIFTMFSDSKTIFPILPLRNYLQLDSYFAGPARRCAGFCIGYGVILLSLPFWVAWKAPLFNGDTEILFPADEILNTLTILIISVPPACVIGLALALHRWKYPKAVNMLFSFLAFLAFTSSGLLAAALFRKPLQFGDIRVFPAIAGAGTIGNGIFGMLICYLFLCIPLAYWAAQLFAANSAAAVVAAQLLHAPRARILFLILRENRFFLLAIMGILSALVVLQTAPAIFVQPANFPLLAPTLVSLAESGLDTQALIGSFASAVLTLLFLACSAFALRLHRKEHRL